MEMITYSPALLEQIARESLDCTVKNESGEKVGVVLSAQVEDGKVIAKVKLSCDIAGIRIA